MKLFEEFKLYETMWEDTSCREAAVVSKETDQLCSVLFDDQQVFTGTKEECEDWVKSKGGRFASRLTIKDSATVNIVESDTKTSVKHISEDVPAACDEAEVAESECKGAECKIAEAQAAKYEILYSDRHTEIVDEDTMDQLVDELESFTRDDVSQIHRIYSNGKLGKTIWTEEEGLL